MGAERLGGEVRTQETSIGDVGEYFDSGELDGNDPGGGRGRASARSQQVVVGRDDHAQDLKR